MPIVFYPSVTTRLRLPYLLSDEEYEKMKQKNETGLDDFSNHPKDRFKPQQICYKNYDLIAYEMYVASPLPVYLAC